MMRKGKATRLIVNSVLLAAIVALGVTVYQAGTVQIPEEGIEHTREVQAEHSGFEQETAEEEVKADSSQVEAELDGNQEMMHMEEANNSEYVSELYDAESNMVSNTAVEAEIGSGLLDFSEESLMKWPVEGNLLMDYSMDKTVYFQTLDQYKVNPAILVQAEEGMPVMAAAEGQVTSIEENQETGLTVTMDLGNGYEAIYGQLENVQVNPGEFVEAAQVLGTVAMPSKYYTKEGNNLYFAMRKNGEPVDPLRYLP